MPADVALSSKTFQLFSSAATSVVDRVAGPSVHPFLCHFVPTLFRLCVFVAVCDFDRNPGRLPLGWVEDTLASERPILSPTRQGRQQCSG